MKSGTRALGIAESHLTSKSTLAGAVVTTTGRADGFVFSSCTVGGLDATDAIIALWSELDREDIQYCFVSGIAPAWFNIIELSRLQAVLPVPVVVLTFEESEGLDKAIRREFAGDEAAIRLRRYAALPPRYLLNIEDSSVFVRSSLARDKSTAIVRSYTVDGSRPEPVRVARLAARAGDAWRRADRSH